MLVEIKKGAVKLETNFSVPPQSNWKSLPSNVFRKPNTISSFVTILKSVMTKQITVLENNSTKSWQCNYHDHIVRNHDSFDKFYQYIKQIQEIGKSTP
jgi:putative transposase